MNRTLRSIAAGLAAGVALTAGGAAATADPPARPGVVKPSHEDRDERHVLKALAQVDKRLAKVADHKHLSRLGEDVRAAVLANIDADRGSLAELADAVRSGDEALDLGQLRRDVRGFGPQHYRQAVQDLRRAARLAERVAETRVALGTFVAPEGSSYDPEPDLLLADQGVATATELALAVTMSSDKQDLRAVKRALAGAQAALGAVRDYLEGEVSQEEPVSEESEVPEEEPVTEAPAEPMP